MQAISSGLICDLVERHKFQLVGNALVAFEACAILKSHRVSGPGSRAVEGLCSTAKVAQDFTTQYLPYLIQWGAMAMYALGCLLPSLIGAS